MKVRTCPACGVPQESNLMVCGSCGSTDIALAPEKLASQEPENPIRACAEGTRRVSVPSSNSIVLELLENPAIGFEVSDGQVVGRTAEADVVITGVPDSDAISRRMAKFRKRGEQWFVEHLGTTNYLMVDGHEVKDQGFEYPIANGSQIAMPLTTFIIRVGGSE